MKKKIAIITALIAALVIGAFAFTACGGEEEKPEPPRYEYYSMVYDAELEGLVLSVAHSALLAEGAISVPSSSYYYADEEGGETVRHDEPVDIVALADGAFEGVSRAHTVSLPSTVKSVGAEAFKNCRNLTSVTLMSSVRIGDEAFFGCDELTEVSGGSISAIGSRAFYGCFRLSSMTEISATTAGEDAFAFCGIDPMA